MTGLVKAAASWENLSSMMSEVVQIKNDEWIAEFLSQNPHYHQIPVRWWNQEIDD